MIIPVKEKDISCCGCICSNCREYKTTCEGCNALCGNVYWTQYIDKNQCPIYTCCREEKHLENCSDCDRLPCEIYYQCVDPSMTKEEHEKTVTERVKILRGNEK